MDSTIDPLVGKWFGTYRELYEWPSGTGRIKSEQKILKLQSSVYSAINENHAGKFATSLVDIHQWKTKNRGNESLNYCKNLHFLGEQYLHEIIDLGPFDNTEKLEELINKLKIEECNLPVCSAIASFIFNRQSVPIIDRFLSRFFARKFKHQLVDDETYQVLQFVKTISFRIRSDGSLGTYTPSDFENSLSKYINDFVPECNRIAQNLRQSNINYSDIHGKEVEFSPIDIEMAIFSYATKHKNLF